ncbi:hypothetical protein [Sulfolobus acidocaldarius]|nr:hypothetical protein [Sulfolobus acidocaldarius]
MIETREDMINYTVSRDKKLIEAFTNPKVYTMIEGSLFEAVEI